MELERIIREPRAKKRWFAVTTAVVLLSGCMVGPDYRRSAVTAPDAFRGVSAATAPDAQSIAEIKWFEIFKDEQL
jgi:outer membrane protein, multidrug efflux system